MAPLRVERRRCDRGSPSAPPVLPSRPAPAPAAVARRPVRAAPGPGGRRQRHRVHRRHDDPVDRDRRLLRSVPHDGSGARGLPPWLPPRRLVRRVPRGARDRRLGQGQARRHAPAGGRRDRQLPHPHSSARPRGAAQDRGHLPEVPLAQRPGVRGPAHTDAVQGGREELARVRGPQHPTQRRRRVRRQPQRPLARPLRVQLPVAGRQLRGDRLRDRHPRRRHGGGVHRGQQDQ